MLQLRANPGKRMDWDLAWDCLLKLTEGGDGEKIMRIPPARSARQRQQEVLTDSLHSQLSLRRRAEAVRRGASSRNCDQKLTQLT